MLLQLSQITGLLQTQNVTQVQNVVQPQNNSTNVQPQTNIKQEASTQKTENTVDTKNDVVNKTSEQKKTTTSKLPSISSLMNNSAEKNKQPQKQVEKVEENKVTYSGSKTTTLEQIEPIWMEFGKKYENQPRLYTIFSEYPIKLEGQTIILEVSNSAQKEKITKLDYLAIDFLNKKLDTNLKLEVKIAEKPIKPKNPYTKDEKYEFLRDKKPEIDQLKQQFNLFID